MQFLHSTFYILHSRYARRGQILVEVLLAALLVFFVSLAVSEAVYTSVKGVDKTLFRSAAIYLANETGESMRAVGKEDWFNIASLATGTANLYHAATSSGKWIATSSSETINLNNTTYTRSFYVSQVNRSTSTDNIVSSGGYYDPSTALLTITVNWTDTYGADTFSQLMHVARYSNQTYGQLDWSGGSVGEQSTTSVSTSFATSTNVDSSSTPGYIQLLAP